LNVTSEPPGHTPIHASWAGPDVWPWTEMTPTLVIVKLDGTVIRTHEISSPPPSSPVFVTVRRMFVEVLK
jgi:hypothetical protein